MLLLPYLGYDDLFKQFHLDEPWDSPCHRQLLPFMPREYDTHSTLLEPGFTDVLAVVGADTGFPPEGIRSLYDLADRRDDLLLMLFAGGRQAVEWTRPVDLDISQGENAFSIVDADSTKPKEVVQGRDTAYDVVVGSVSRVT